MTDKRISYVDQLGFFDPLEYATPIHVIGAGGIGSAVAVQLGKLGVRELHVWDEDVVEGKNIPGQLPYRPSDIGRPKVEALSAYFVRQEMETRVFAHREMVGPNTDLRGLVISGVDSMAARIDIWEAVRDNPFVPLYIDGRVGGEYLQLLTVDPIDPDSAASYARWLFDDNDDPELECSMRAVCFVPGTLAGYIVAQFTLHVRREPMHSSIFIDLKTSQAHLPK